jgi:iron(II)-dependent oxidoreductase
MEPIRDVASAAALLADARERTHLLIEPVAEEDLRRQHDPLMGPILWDLGHIAAFEELWLTRNVRGRIEFAEMPGLYSPFEHPRRVRGELPLPSLAETLAYMDAVRARALCALEQLDFASEDPLVRDGYVVAMVAQHEDQHQETILQTLQLKQGAPYRTRNANENEKAHEKEQRHAGLTGGSSDAGAAESTGNARAAGGPAMARFPGGEVELGTEDRAVAYDNERPEHTVVLRPFDIDVTPVTNGQYLEFVSEGGYWRAELWSEAGRVWLSTTGVVAPKHWRRRGGEWCTRSMDAEGPVEPDHPVCHVCWHEAEAFARWAGKRLPTEAEWEAAATWDPVAGRARLAPWGEEAADGGRANVDQLAFGTLPVGSHPGNVSPIGCRDTIGGVWEWTASDLAPYPGFVPFPYREYTEVFFGPEYRVLRGGSWATRGRVARATFRNWDYPNRRQIFSGFRCARDA